MIGTIVDVQDTRGEMRAFNARPTLSSSDMLIADDVDYGFDLDHLREHLATGDPVR